MPPKIPFLRFKPKEPVVKDEPVEETQETVLSSYQQQRLAATPPPAPPQPSQVSAPSHGMRGQPFQQPRVVKKEGLGETVPAQPAARREEMDDCVPVSMICVKTEENPTAILPIAVEGASSASLEKKQEESGTAFLHAAEAERQKGYSANRDYFLNPQLGKEEELIWLQLPLPAGADAQRFSALPPGRVGKLRVYKSGRTELILGGVSFDARVQSRGTHEPMAQSAVAVVEEATQDQSTSCFELGSVHNKVVCTPQLP